MTKDQRKKIIGYLCTNHRDWFKKWEADGILKFNKGHTQLFLGEDKIPLEINGECASINERFVNPTLLELFIQSVGGPPSRGEMPSLEPADDDFPRLGNLTRHYFVRMMFRISNRLWETGRSDEFIFDQNYLIDSSGAVCGWDWDNSKPIELQPDQSVSALDYELIQMAKELKRELKDKNCLSLVTKDGKEHVSIKQAFNALNEVHGGSDD